MEIKTYTKKDGSTGQEHWLQKDDKVIAKNDKPYMKEFSTGSINVTKYSIGVVLEGKEFYLSLTKGQYTRLLNLSKEESLLGKNLVGTEYTNTYGTFVGVKVE